jgi:hypothetical protein
VASIVICSHEQYRNEKTLPKVNLQIKPPCGSPTTTVTMASEELAKEEQAEEIDLGNLKIANGMNVPFNIELFRANHVAETSSIKPTITSLAADVHSKLFETLDAVTSACLGLTCKSFYSTHRPLHWSVPLQDLVWIPATTSRPSSLHSLKGLISDWMAPLVIGRAMYTPRFATQERMDELVAEYSKDVRSGVRF